MTRTVHRFRNARALGGLVGLSLLAGLQMNAGHAQQASPTPNSKEPAPPPSVTILGARDAHGVLGRDVRSSTGEDMGHNVDVIVDLTGTVRAAVIDKDRNPKWSPPEIEDVTAEMLAPYFAEIGADELKFPDSK